MCVCVCVCVCVSVHACVRAYAAVWVYVYHSYEVILVITPNMCLRGVTDNYVKQVFMRC